MRWPGRRTDDGFVLVWAAIFMLLLITMAGMAIDIGNWHLRAAKLQRASDAAALAAVVKLPDENAARQLAIETLAKNGFGPDATKTVTFTAVASDRYSVEVTDNKVDTLFASFVLDHLSISRKSTAKYRGPVKMGNPTNHIGTGQQFEGTFRDVPYHGFLLAINGHCSAAEFGDPIASRYDGNAGSSDGSLPSVCDGSRGELTPAYKPITALDGGYNFIIEVPATGQAQNLYVYDGPFAPKVTSSITGLTSDDNAHKSKGDTFTPKIETNFRLYATPEATKEIFSDDTRILSKTFYTAGKKDACVTVWCQLGNTPLSPGTYRLNVTTPYAGDGRAYGNNSFGVRVAPSPNGEIGFNLPGTNPYTCDNRDNALCPQVYAVDALSVLTRTGIGVGNFYLADIEKDYFGSPMKISMWDPGDGASYLQLVRPDQKCMPLEWYTPPFLNSAGFGGSVSSEDCDSTDSRLSVEGTSTLLPGRTNNNKFNDRWVEMSTAVPANYPDVVDTAMGDTWWKVRYVPPTQDTNRDRTVWRISVDDGGPVHLVANQ